MKEKTKNKLISFICDIITALTWVAMIVYAPLYIASWLLHKVARFLLAIAYLGMLDWRKSIDIFKSLFTRYGKLPRI